MVLSFPFTLPYYTIELTLLQIIKPDGTVHNIDFTKQSRVMVDDSQMHANIYNPNDKILKVNIPNLQVGDIIRYVTYLKQTKAIIPNTWFDYFLFESTAPIKHLVFKIIAPNSLPLKKIEVFGINCR